MKTCTTCAMKHLPTAEFFVHEALAGYPHHLLKALGQMDHVEIETMQDWPEFAAIVHEQKKFITDAIENMDMEIAKKVDFDGLEILVMAIEGMWDWLKYNPHNSKVYDASYWINLGMDIRNSHNLPNPDFYYDKWFTEQVEAASNGHVEPEELDELA